MILYHFTAGEYLRGIAEFGLTVGDVPTDLNHLRSKVGVWLTTSEIAEGRGLDGSAVQKKRFRLKVDVPDDKHLVRWSDWALDNVTKHTREYLKSAGGGQSSTWLIYFGKLDPARIVEVVNTISGSLVNNWRTSWPGFGSWPGVKYEDRFSWRLMVAHNIRRELIRQGLATFRRVP